MSIGKCSAHEIHVCMATRSLTNRYMNIWGSILVAQHDTNCHHGNCIPEKYGKMMCCLSDFLFNLGHVMLYESWLLETCLL